MGRQRVEIRPLTHGTSRLLCRHVRGILLPCRTRGSGGFDDSRLHVLERNATGIDLRAAERIEDRLHELRLRLGLAGAMADGFAYLFVHNGFLLEHANPRLRDLMLLRVGTPPQTLSRIFRQLNQQVPTGKQRLCRDERPGAQPENSSDLTTDSDKGFWFAKYLARRGSTN